MQHRPEGRLTWLLVIVGLLSMLALFSTITTTSPVQPEITCDLCE